MSWQQLVMASAGHADIPHLVVLPQATWHHGESCPQDAAAGRAIAYIWAQKSVHGMFAAGILRDALLLAGRTPAVALHVAHIHTPNEQRWKLWTLQRSHGMSPGQS